MPVLSVRTKLREIAASLDELVTRLGHLVVVLFFWPVAYAVALGSSVFAIRHMSWLPLIQTNKVPLIDSIKMALWSAGALILLGVIYGAVLLSQRLRRGVSGGLSTVAELHRRLRPVLALPVLPALMVPAVERDSPKETLFLIALAAFATGAGVYAWARGPSVEGPMDLEARLAPSEIRRTLSKAGAVLAVTLLWAGYGGFFSWLSITNHRALNTRTTDLGYYDNIFYNSIHGKLLGCTFIRAGYHGSAHFDPLLILLSPLYLIHPGAELLLVLQSVWLGAGVVPLYLLAHAKLRRRLPAVAIAAMYAMYPALHGANMYEFHSLSLLSPIVLTALYFLEIGAYRRYYLTLVPALLCREDVALVMCFVGAYAIFTRRPRLVRLGWITIGVSLLYFAIVKRFFMTSADIFMSGPNAYSFAYYYEDLIPNHNGMGGLIVSLVSNPVFVLRTVLGEPKILYVVTLFLPLVFLPFVAKPARIMLLYGLLFCMLATRGAVYSVHFQYSSVILPIAFALTPEALRQIEEGRLAGGMRLDGLRLSKALLGGALVASTLTSWKFGGIVDNQSFKGGFVRIARGLSDKERQTYAWIREQTAKIPAKASVGVTNRTGAHASNRMNAYFYPERVDEDWLFLDEAELKAPDLDKLKQGVQTGALELIARREKLVFYRKKP